MRTARWTAPEMGVDQHWGSAKALPIGVALLLCGEGVLHSPSSSPHKNPMKYMKQARAGAFLRELAMCRHDCGH